MRVSQTSVRGGKQRSSGGEGEEEESKPDVKRQKSTSSSTEGLSSDSLASNWTWDQDEEDEEELSIPDNDTRCASAYHHNKISSGFIGPGSPQIKLVQQRECSSFLG